MCPLNTDLELNEYHASASPCYEEGQGIMTRPSLRAKVCLGLTASLVPLTACMVQKMQAVVEKTETSLSWPGRGIPGAHTSARMWEMSTQTYTSFLGGKMLVCEQRYLPVWQMGHLHFGFTAGSVGCLLLSEQTRKQPICVCLLLERLESITTPPPQGRQLCGTTSHLGKRDQQMTPK